MKELGEGFWVRFDEVPTSYKDRLVTDVSELTHFF